MSTQDLQNQLTALKAQAYDEIAQVEFHQNQLRQINDLIGKTNNMLIESIVKDKEAGNSNQIPGAAPQAEAPAAPATVEPPPAAEVPPAPPSEA